METLRKRSWRQASSSRRSAFLLGLFAASGCSEHLPSSRPGTRTERPIEVIVPTEIATLDPRFATRSLDVKVTRLVHAGLFGLSPEELSPVPLLVESHSMPDDLTLRLRLRPGLTFHGGKPLVARDVCATLEAVADPAVQSPHRSVLAAFARCEEVSPREVVLHLSKRRATLLSDLELPVLREDEARSPPRPDGSLDGLGPFAISRMRASEVELVPRATGVLPLARRALAVRTVRDENARAQRLLAGRSDVAPNAISPGLLPALEGAPGIQIVSRAGANVTYLLFHNERAPFDRAEVRRAASRAIDRQLIVSTLLGGRAQVATALLPPGHWAGGASERVPVAIGEASRAELSAVGEVVLLTSTDRVRVTLSRAVAEMLTDAGIRTTVLPLDLGVLLSRLDAGDFELAILQIPELTEPNVLSWFFHPAGVPGEGGLGRNRARYRSAEAGRLLDLASEVQAREQRRAAYRALAGLMDRDMPVAPLWHEDQVAVLSPRALGFVPSAEGRWLGLARLP